MLSKTVYTYNADSGEYQGQETAFESPREPGVFLLPANSTETAPPTCAAHKVACWNAEQAKWVKRADYRGGVYYDKATQERHEITELGVAPESGWTDVEPTDTAAEWDEAMGAWVVPFATKKDRKIAEVQAHSNGLIAAIQQGYTNGEVKSFEQQNQGAKDILSGDETPPEAQFVIALLSGRLGAAPTAEETAAFAQRIRANYDAAAAATAQIVGTQQRLELAARAATTEAELEAIHWPE